MGKRIFCIVMIFFIGLWLTGCFKTIAATYREKKLKVEALKKRKSDLESQIYAIDQMLPEIDAEIAKHQTNVKKMKDRLRKARESGTTPDVSGLKEYATASGGRTDAYHNSSEWKKKLIDKFEGMHVFNALDASRLAAATVDGNVEEVFISNEINRSSRFITMLEVHKQRQEEALTKANDELERINEELDQAYGTASISEDDSASDKDDSGY